MFDCLAIITPLTCVALPFTQKSPPSSVTLRILVRGEVLPATPSVMVAVWWLGRAGQSLSSNQTLERVLRVLDHSLLQVHAVNNHEQHNEVHNRYLKARAQTQIVLWYVLSIVWLNWSIIYIWEFIWKELSRWKEVTKIFMSHVIYVQHDKHSVHIRKEACINATIDGLTPVSMPICILKVGEGKIWLKGSVYKKDIGHFPIPAFSLESLE